MTKSAIDCLAFDFAGSIGIAHIRAGRSELQGRVDPRTVDIVNLECVTLPEAVENEFNGKNKAVRARIHDPEVWKATREMFKQTILTAWGRAGKMTSRRLVIAYEQVMFASSVFWAQFYGGLVATMHNVVLAEFNDHERMGVYIRGVNVSRIKSELTGDSGAPKDVVAAALRSYLDRAPLPVRRNFEAIKPVARQHDVTDALACGIAALKLASGHWEDAA